MPVLLWVDDERPAPPGWVWAKTARQALKVLSSGQVTYASLDCDLGHPVENGVWLVKKMVQFGLWPEHKVGVHSSNWEKAAEMLYIVRHEGPYDEYSLLNGFSHRHGQRR